MQIIKLELTHYQFFNPATGEQILYEEDCNEDAKSLMGYWIDEFLDEPFIKNKTLEKAWKKFQKNAHQDFESPFEKLRTFFSNYPEKGWAVFELTSEGDPITVWHVLDLRVGE